MNRVAQHPIKAFSAALAAVAVLSIMDAVMKALVIAIGVYAVSIWRSLVTLTIAAALYLPHRLDWPNRATLKIHVWRGVIVMVMHCCSSGGSVECHSPRPSHSPSSLH